VSILQKAIDGNIKSNSPNINHSFRRAIIAVSLCMTLVTISHAQKGRCQHLGTERLDLPHQLRAETRSNFTLQVVFHILWQNESENISDERIQSQMIRINEDFNQLNADIALVPSLFQEFIGSADIEFILATEDPFGAPTTGINRKQTDIKNIGSVLSTDQKEVIKYSTLGGIDAWDTNRYINVWIGSTVDVFGLTTPLEVAGTADDGIIITSEAFGELEDVSSITNKGRTLTHELGHYFGLTHLWGRNNGCGTDDDGLEDTPEQERPYSGCKIFPQVSCGSVDMNMNFMDFSNDTCLLFFTKGQVKLMRSVLTSLRSGIIVSDEIPLYTPDLEDLSISQDAHSIYIKSETPLEGPVYIDSYSISGQPIYKQNLNILNDYQLNTNTLPKGVYILSIRTAYSRFTYTFAAGF